MPKIITSLTLDGVRDLIQHQKNECRNIMSTFGSTPNMEAKINAYDYCLHLISRVK